MARPIAALQKRERNQSTKPPLFQYQEPKKLGNELTSPHADFTSRRRKTISAAPHPENGEPCLPPSPQTAACSSPRRRCPPPCSPSPFQERYLSDQTIRQIIREKKQKETCWKDRMRHTGPFLKQNQAKNTKKEGEIEFLNCFTQENQEPLSL